MGVLEKSLSDCLKASSEGYKLAEKYSDVLEKSMNNSAQNIADTLKDFTSETAFLSDLTKQLNEQMSSISEQMKNISTNVRADISMLKERLSFFTVVLFGRTMAGKSTLMEILKQGTGESIGKGAQRTTRDVREYEWNGMKIIDVPGIASIDGREDDEIAFEAAKKADLVLFLITDDAPQPGEADCLQAIKAMGKTVICIMNVKTGNKPNQSIKMTIRDISKKMSDTSRLDGIKNQFLAFGKDWSDITFVYTHLKSEFESIHCEDLEQKKLLHELSKFEDVENAIISEIANHGTILRTKTFVDIIGVPVLRASEELAKDSISNKQQAKVFEEKIEKLESWIKRFANSSEARISRLISELRTTIESRIATFAEHNYDNKNASSAWQKEIEKVQIEEKCQTLINELADQCDEEIRELTREMANELKFTNTVFKDNSLDMDDIVDGKRIWNWSFTIAGAGVSIAAIITGFLGVAAAGPLGWIALGLGVVGWIGSLFFRDKKKIIREKRERLEQNLRSSTTKQLDTISTKLKELVKKELINGRLASVSNDLKKIKEKIVVLSKAQNQAFIDLNHSLSEINLVVLNRAFILTGCNGLIKIRAIGRIPGEKVLFISAKKCYDNEESQLLPIGKLLHEKISIHCRHDDIRMQIAEILTHGIGAEQLSVGDGIVQLNSVYEKADITDIRIAQQLTNTLITK